MEENDSIFERDNKINSLNMNTNKKLGLFGLLGIVKDVTGEHADKLGFGYEESKNKGFFWVLIRQKLLLFSATFSELKASCEKMSGMLEKYGISKFYPGHYFLKDNLCAILYKNCIK